MPRPPRRGGLRPAFQGRASDRGSGKRPPGTSRRRSDRAASGKRWSAYHGTQRSGKVLTLRDWWVEAGACGRRQIRMVVRVSKSNPGFANASDGVVDPAAMVNGGCVFTACPFAHFGE
jgi:hypothetical protein